MPDLASPAVRLQEARKQLGLALQDIDDDVARLDIMVAAADVENARRALTEEVDS